MNDQTNTTVAPPAEAPKGRAKATTTPAILPAIGATAARATTTTITPNTTITPAAPTLVPVRLLYDAWDEAGERLAAGLIHDLPRDFAARLLAEGKAERADPLPGA